MKVLLILVFDFFGYWTKSEMKDENFQKIRRFRFPMQRDGLFFLSGWIIWA